MYRRCLTAVTLLILPALALAAPNFSGNWKIDFAKSNFGAMGAPERFERAVTHDEPRLNYTTSYSFQGREVISALKYTTDGKEATNNVNGTETKGTAKWDGDVLVIESTRPVQDGEIKMVERWTAADGGKAIQVEAKMNPGSPQEMTFQIYLNKQ